MKNLLLKTSAHEQVQAYNIECNEKIAIEVSLNIVLEEFLIRIGELLKIIPSSSITYLRDFTRRK